MLLDPLHCYKKFIHAVGDRHQPRKNIRPLRTVGVASLSIRHSANMLPCTFPQANLAKMAICNLYLQIYGSFKSPQKFGQQIANPQIAA